MEDQFRAVGRDLNLGAGREQRAKSVGGGKLFNAWPGDRGKSRWANTIGHKIVSCKMVGPAADRAHRPDGQIIR